MLKNIAYNVQGFLLCWYSVIRQPELRLSKVNAVDNIIPLLGFIRPARTKVDKRTGGSGYIRQPA